MSRPKNPAVLKNTTTTRKIVNCYAVVFLLPPPREMVSAQAVFLVRRGPLGEEEVKETGSFQKRPSLGILVTSE